ncbi:transposase [Streptomyces sp. NPDC002962]|uniref:transposase n=1 Tax=Streptomyces sp. NPDC002962 TaxID=3364674 RepID=UPI0036B0BA92
MDSQSVRTADTVPAATRGFDAGKKAKGRKRFVVTDTLGLLLAVQVVATSVQDRDGARRPLLWSRLDHSRVKKIWADRGLADRQDSRRPLHDLRAVSSASQTVQLVPDRLAERVVLWTE